MPLYLKTRGNPTLAIGICSRCSRKFPLDKLQPDPNYPGLRVCEKDMDQYDPYRLPARQTENIALPFVRPDTGIPTNPSGVISEDGNVFLVTEEGDDFLIFFEDGEL
tara:strand:+ start:1849 stop:2169 length:321 start_codon:yes stop_codon:yes gene_type:complete